VLGNSGVSRTREPMTENDGGNNVAANVPRQRGVCSEVAVWWRDDQRGRDD
jgi:hypothetical protein